MNWSPEGTLLAAPGAELPPPPVKGEKEDLDADVIKVEKENTEPTSSTTKTKKECIVIFARGTLQTPLLLIPCPEPSVATRWCPILFKLKDDQENKLCNLQDRMILGR